MLKITKSKLREIIRQAIREAEPEGDEESGRINMDDPVMQKTGWWKENPDLTVGGVLKQGEEHPAHDAAKKEVEKEKGAGKEDKPEPKQTKIAVDPFADKEAKPKAEPKAEPEAEPKADSDGVIKKYGPSHYDTLTKAGLETSKTIKNDFLSDQQYDGYDLDNLVKTLQQQGHNTSQLEDAAADLADAEAEFDDDAVERIKTGYLGNQLKGWHSNLRPDIEHKKREAEKKAKEAEKAAKAKKQAEFEKRKQAEFEKSLKSYSKRTKKQKSDRTPGGGGMAGALGHRTKGRRGSGMYDAKNYGKNNKLTELLLRKIIKEEIELESLRNAIRKTVREIDFKDKESFEKYKSQHKMRSGTKVNIAGKETTVGAASGDKDSETGKDDPRAGRGRTKQTFDGPWTLRSAGDYYDDSETAYQSGEDPIHKIATDVYYIDKYEGGGDSFEQEAVPASKISNIEDMLAADSGNQLYISKGERGYFDGKSFTSEKGSTTTIDHEEVGVLPRDWKDDDDYDAVDYAEEFEEKEDSIKKLADDGWSPEDIADELEIPDRYMDDIVKITNTIDHEEVGDRPAWDWKDDDDEETEIEKVLKTVWGPSGFEGTEDDTFEAVDLLRDKGIPDDEIRNWLDDEFDASEEDLEYWMTGDEDVYDDDDEDEWEESIIPQLKKEFKQYGFAQKSKNWKQVMI